MSAFPAGAGPVTAGAMGGSSSGSSSAAAGTGATTPVAAGSDDGGSSGGENESVGGEAGAAGAPATVSCDPIAFEDPDFEAAVRATIGKPSGALRSEDVVGLTSLAASGVSSIAGVECLVNLTDLDIGGLPFGHVTDLTPLARLEQLEVMDVGRNPLGSLALLGRLPRLKQLS